MSFIEGVERNGKKGEYGNAKIQKENRQQMIALLPS